MYHWLKAGGRGEVRYWCWRYYMYIQGAIWTKLVKWWEYHEAFICNYQGHTHMLVGILMYWYCCIGPRSCSLFTMHRNGRVWIMYLKCRSIHPQVRTYQALLEGWCWLGLHIQFNDGHAPCHPEGGLAHFQSWNENVVDTEQLTVFVKQVVDTNNGNSDDVTNVRQHFTTSSA